MQITITWHLAVLIVLIVALWVWQAYEEPDYFGFKIRGLFSLIGTIFLIVIYGGIYWW